MKLDGITTFVAVAEAGSISEAVRRLGLSKSVVSDRLTELERSLDARLVHCSTRNLTLTEDGLAFLERASRIAQEKKEAAADMAQRRGALVGPLRISAPVTFARAGGVSVSRQASRNRVDPRSRRSARSRQR
jgi:DNA-binding transcriptional LysR family regulator